MFGKILNLLWQFLYAIEQIFTDVSKLPNIEK